VRNRLKNYAAPMLQRVLKIDDMAAFEQHWRQWVMQLRFE